MSRSGPIANYCGMEPIGRRTVLKTGLAAAGLTLAGASTAFAAPKAKLWDRWLAHNAVASGTVDHQAWDGFLAAYRQMSNDGISRIAYGAVSASDRDSLDAYVRAQEATPVSELNRAEQYAYWVNLYNAATVRLIIDNYPVDSILDLDLSPGLFRFGPWDAKLLQVEGEDLTLNDIEHRILRPIWSDPRTHYAVNCASVSCPNLMPQAFTGANSDAFLDENARAYVNHPRGVAVLGGERLVVSKIYKWFRSDFGRRDRDVIAHLRSHADPNLEQQLAQFTTIDDHRYDWSLNDAATA